LQDCGGSLKNKSILKISGGKNEEFLDKQKPISLLLAQTKNWERLGFEGGKHCRENYLDFWKRRNRLVVFRFLKPRQGHSALPFLLLSFGYRQLQD